MSNLIDIRGLDKTLGDFELQDISLSLAPGYIMGFVGPNGAGKSTTIKLMLNLLRKQSGDLRLFGLDADKDEAAIKQKIGFVLDDSYYYEGMTVGQVGWLLSGFYREWDETAFRRYLEKYELPKKKKVKELSTGMKAKLSMALALCHHAKLLILDEPTSGLDPVVRSDILAELYEVVRDPECGVFLSTHITSDLDKVADFVTFIQKGRITLSTSRDEIDENYALVKGAKKDLPQAKGFLMRYTETSFGFEGLTCQAAALRKQGQFLLEKAHIEDILLYLEKGEAVC